MIRSFLNRIRHALSKNSHLYPYLPITREPYNKKIQRLIGDQSNHQYKIEPGIPTQPRDRRHSQLKFQPANQYYSILGKVAINPCNSWLTLWYALVFCAIIYFFTETTLMVIYGEVAWQSELASMPMLFVDMVMLLVLMVDMSIQLNAGYITRGAIIINRQRVVNRYMHYYIYYDSAVVILIFAALVSQNFYVNYAKLIVLGKFIRMFQMNTIVQRKLNTRAAARVVYMICKQFVSIFVLSHLLGIGFWYIDNVMVNEPICQDNSNLCWLESSTAYSPINAYDWEIQYFYSLYWGFNTITNISYGDIAPDNQYQTIYGIFAWCFGLIVYAYITNNIIKAVIFATYLRDQNRVRLIQFDGYMDLLKVDQEGQFQVIQYIKQRYLQENSRDLNLEEIMKGKLTFEIKSELVRDAYRNVENGLKYFCGNHPSLTKLLFELKEKKFSNGETVLFQGEPIKQLRYLYRGALKIFCNFNSREFHIKTSNIPDEFFASYEFFVKERSQVTAISQGKSIVYLIPQEAFQQQSKQNSEFKQILLLLEYELRIMRKLDRIFMKCLFCGKTHRWFQCNQMFPDFRFVSLQNSSGKLRDGFIRLKQSKHKTWRDRGRLYQLNRIVNRSRDKILRGLQNRLFVLKRRLDEREQLDVDSCYDWSIFLPEENLKKFKLHWNIKHCPQRLTCRF